MSSNPRSSSDRSLRRAACLATLIGGSLGLTACYVVPLQEAPHVHTGGHAPVPAVVVAPAAPTSTTFTARLYPTNDQAREAGMATASVTNDMNGRGTFWTVIQGEHFTGEATRVNQHTREGRANGVGNRGSYLQCTYTMNSSTQGVGRCQHSNGAVFSMHVGG